MTTTKIMIKYYSVFKVLKSNELRMIDFESLTTLSTCSILVESFFRSI